MARSKGLFPVITCTQRDPELEVAAAKELLSYQVDSLICTGATDPDRISALCAAAGVRTLNLDLPGTQAVSVISDNYGGAHQLTHLILNRRRTELAAQDALIFVGGRASDHNTAERIRGFVAAHREQGIEVPKGNILACGYAADKAASTLQDLGPARAKGIFVNSTISLEGAVSWLSKLQTHEKHDIRIGCFDWDPFAALLPENVGMVQQDVPRMLGRVFELLAAPAARGQSAVIPCIVNELHPPH